jgi:hypothetical protein
MSLTWSSSADEMRFPPSAEKCRWLTASWFSLNTFPTRMERITLSTSFILTIGATEDVEAEDEAVDDGFFVADEEAAVLPGGCALGPTNAAAASLYITRHGREHGQRETAATARGQQRNAAEDEGRNNFSRMLYAGPSSTERYDTPRGVASAALKIWPNKYVAKTSFPPRWPLQLVVNTSTKRT